ncbi:hypothetical protein GCM10010433_03850 [Streptomyces pulveraceus]
MAGVLGRLRGVLRGQPARLGPTGHRCDVLRGLGVPAPAHPRLGRQRLRERLRRLAAVRWLLTVRQLGLLRIRGLLGVLRLLGVYGWQRLGLRLLRVLRGGRLPVPLPRLRLAVRPLSRLRLTVLPLPVRSLPLGVRRGQGLRRGLLRGVLVRRLRPPGLPPRLAARRGGLIRRAPWYPGLAATRGQHDTFVRGPYSRELLLVTLSALRHRDSYV